MDNQVSNPQTQQPVPKKKRFSKVLIVGIILFGMLVIAGSVSAWLILKDSGETSESTDERTSDTQEEEVSETETSDSVTATRSNEFWIYEEYIGDWESVTEVEERPEITESGAYDCVWEHFNDYSECHIEENDYKLIQRGDNYTVTQNEAIIWKQDVPSGPCNGVTGFKALGYEFMLDYLSLTPARDSIVVSNDETLLDILDDKGYDSVFAPYAVMGNMTYIAEKDDKQFVVYDDMELGEKYDEIYYACCCEGMLYTIRGDGNIIDFFARKGDEWYHIRGGKQENVEP